MKVMSLIKDKLLKSDFNRNVLILAGGTAVAQAVPILISPILTRLYTPEDFGAFAIFTSITSIVSVIACGRYELAIMLPEKDEDAINVAAVAFLFNVFISTLFFLIILFCGDWLLEVLNAKNLGWLIYLAPLSVFLAGTFSILNYTNNRFKLYKDISKANIYKSLAGAVVQVIMGFFKFGAVGLVSGNLISQFTSNFKLLKNIKSYFSYVRWELIKVNFFSYKKFPTYSMFGAFLDNLSSNLFLLFIPYYFGVKLAGLYFFSWKLINVPFSLIASSISQVFFREISFLLKENIKDAKSFLFNTTLKLFYISVIVNLLLLIFIYLFWEIVFGKDWEEGKIIAIFLVVAYMVRFIASPLSITLVAVNKLEYLVLWQGLYLLIEMLVCSISYMLNLDFNKFLILVLIGEWLSYSVYLHIIYRSIKH